VSIRKNGHEIHSIDEWYQFAPPRGGERHWQDGRSAKELARAWVDRGLGPHVPQELAALLNDNRLGVPLDEWIAYPEHRVPIDRLPGEPPNIDLAIDFKDGDRPPLAVCIEAKADEPFGEEVFVKLTTAAWKIAHDERTNVVTRIQTLAARLLPPWGAGLAHLGELRYQLLTGVAGTLAFAELISAEKAVFVVHEFVDVKRTTPENLARNADDLNRFVRRISGVQGQEMNPGTLIGPLRLTRIKQELFIGKIRSDLPPPGA